MTNTSEPVIAGTGLGGYLVCDWAASGNFLYPLSMDKYAFTCNVKPLYISNKMLHSNTQQIRVNGLYESVAFTRCTKQHFVFFGWRADYLIMHADYTPGMVHMHPQFCGN